MLALSEDEAQRAAEQALKPSRIEIVLVKPKDRQARHGLREGLVRRLRHTRGARRLSARRSGRYATCPPL